MGETYVFGFYFAGITDSDGSAPKTPRHGTALWLFEFVDTMMGCDDFHSCRVLSLGINEAIIALTFNERLTETQALERVKMLFDNGLSGAATLLRAQRFTVEVYTREAVACGDIQRALASSITHVEVTR